MFTSSLLPSFRVKVFFLKKALSCFLCKQLQQHHRGSTKALLCWLQAGLKKPLGVTVSCKCETGELLWSSGALDCIQGFLW